MKKPTYKITTKYIINGYEYISKDMIHLIKEQLGDDKIIIPLTEEQKEYIQDNKPVLSLHFIPYLYITKITTGKDYDGYGCINIFPNREMDNEYIYLYPNYERLFEYEYEDYKQRAFDIVYDLLDQVEKIKEQEIDNEK